MNPVGCHALVWAGGWSPDECRRAVFSTRDAGFDLIEIPLLDPRSVDVAMTSRALTDAGIGARCSLGLSAATDISSTDDAAVAAGEALLMDAVSATRDLGSPYLCGVLYSALGKYLEMPTERGRANVVAVLGRVARKAAQAGVSLGLEIVNRYETNVINTCEQALLLLDEIGEPNVRIHLDTYHMNIEERDFRTPVLLAGDRLGYVHIGESNRGYLGEGTVDFDTFFNALGEIGYAGTITFESFSSAVVAPELSRILGIWRNTWTDGADLAAKARAFIAAGMAAAGMGQA